MSTDLNLLMASFADAACPSNRRFNGESFSFAVRTMSESSWFDRHELTAEALCPVGF